MRPWLLFLHLFLAFPLAQPGPASAQETGASGAGTQSSDAENSCSVEDANNIISIILCPPGLDQSDWQKAGELACADRLPCGAWIWDEKDKMPAAAPENHDGLSRSEVTSALAVWVAEQELLITIESGK